MSEADGKPGRAKAERSVAERRGCDSRSFHDDCRAGAGIQITLLHSVPICMPLCHLQAGGGGGGERGAGGRERELMEEERWALDWRL